MTSLTLFGSHIPILVKILEKTNGDILELGVGLSTIVIHLMAYKTKRNILSYESNEKWYKDNLQYESDFHKIKFVKDWDKADLKGFWDVVLIDHWPDRRRPEEVKRLANSANYIILHDSDIYDKFYTKSGIYDLFKYRFNYTKCFPSTVVLSNFKELDL